VTIALESNVVLFVSTYALFALKNLVFLKISCWLALENVLVLWKMIRVGRQNVKKLAQACGAGGACGTAASGLDKSNSVKRQDLIVIEERREVAGISSERHGER
jgi:hypothetical protein